MQPLHVENKKIVDSAGNPVYLRGICIGSWLNKENFLTGFLGTDLVMTRTMYQELGKERADAFFKTYHDVFITDADFRYLSSIGMNVVRIAVNYRFFEDDMNPLQYRPEGFHYLDKAVAFGRAHGIYIILDLHALPGGQNYRWHSDNNSGSALLWEHRDFQKRTIALWKHIAQHYKDEPVIAGYDLINEPEAPDLHVLRDFYEELIALSTASQEAAFAQTLEELLKSDTLILTSTATTSDYLEALNQLLGDSHFQKSGSTYTSTLEQDGITILFHLYTSGGQVNGYGMEMTASETIGMEMTMTMEMKGDDMSLLLEMAGMTMEMDGAYRPSSAAPETEPPAGATVVDLMDALTGDIAPAPEPEAA